MNISESIRYYGENYALEVANQSAFIVATSTTGVIIANFFNISKNNIIENQTNKKITLKIAYALYGFTFLMSVLNYGLHFIYKKDGQKAETWDKPSR